MGNFEILINDGLILIKQEEYDEALQVFFQAMQNYPEEVTCIFHLGRAYHFADKNAEAVPYLKKYNEQQKKSARGLFLLGLVYYKLTDYYKSIECFNEMLTFHNYDTFDNIMTNEEQISLGEIDDAYKYLAKSFLELKEFNKSLGVYNFIINRGCGEREKADLLYERGLVYKEQSDIKNTIQDFKKSIEIFLGLRSISSFKQKKIEEMKDFLSKYY